MTQGCKGRRRKKKMSRKERWWCCAWWRKTRRRKGEGRCCCKRGGRKVERAADREWKSRQVNQARNWQGEEGSYFDGWSHCTKAQLYLCFFCCLKFGVNDKVCIIKLLKKIMCLSSLRFWKSGQSLIFVVECMIKKIYIYFPRELT